MLDRLADGSLNLTTARLVVPHLTADNEHTLLSEACGKSRRQVEELVARVAPRPDVPCSVRAVIDPLSPDRYEVRFTVAGKTVEKLRRAQQLLRHAVPDGDLGEVVDRALTLLLEDLARNKFAVVRHPHTSQGTAPGSREIAAKVRRAVWHRDGDACAFVGKGGHRCNERAFSEFHHLEPYATGGEGTADNIMLYCRAHNDYERERVYGPRPARVTRSGTS